MKYLILAFLLSGCAQHQWKPLPYAKTNVAEAHNDCTVKARIVVGDEPMSFRWSNFMEECMAGQGYE